MSNRWIVLVLVAAVVLLPGATCLHMMDTAAGVDAEGNPTGTAPLESVGSVGRLLGIPFAGEAAGALCALWALIRGRRWKSLANAGFEAVNTVRNAADGLDAATIKVLLDRLAKEQDKAGLRTMAVKAIEKIES